jgi:hypothetical protein
MSEVDIRLSARPDGFGFISGEARLGDQTIHICILPPEHLRQGDIAPDDVRPDTTHWQAFADGELIARIAREEDVGASLVALLTSAAR